MTSSASKVRFEGDSGVDIAVQEIDAVSPDGKKKRIILRLGAPFRIKGFTCIWTELDNLDRTGGPIMGEGSFHTLVLVVRWIVLRLESFEKKRGYRYFWPDSNDTFDYRDFFSAVK
jgi:hypothetical protein